MGDVGFLILGWIIYLVHSDLSGQWIDQNLLLTMLQQKLIMNTLSTKRPSNFILTRFYFFYLNLTLCNKEQTKGKDYINLLQYVTRGILKSVLLNIINHSFLFLIFFVSGHTFQFSGLLLTLINKSETKHTRFTFSLS